MNVERARPARSAATATRWHARGPFALRHLIPLGLAAFGLLAAGGIFVLRLQMSDTRTEQVVSSLLTAIGNTTGAEIAAGLRSEDTARVRGAIEQLQALRGLQLAVLVDQQHAVLQATRSTMVGQDLDLLATPGAKAMVDEAMRRGLPTHRRQGDTLWHANAIVRAAPTLPGEVRQMNDYGLLLVYDFSLLRAEQHAEAVNEALMMAAALLLASLLSWLFLRSALLRRMASLVEASRRIGAGDLKTPVRWEGRDEIAILGAALDSMRGGLDDGNEHLQRATRELQQAHASVEFERASLARRVAERTAELTASNAALERARDAAEAASRAKSLFLATVSHEIRTPMNGVLGAMELLEYAGLDGDKAELLRTAQSSARALLGLLNDLLDMAKIEAGRIEIRPEPVPLARLVTQVLATHAATALTKGIVLSPQFGPDTPAWVRTDPLRVSQILGNLVHNAVKFTDRGSVTLQLHGTAIGGGMHRVRFAVRDTGPGIAPDVLPSLFQPFEQGATELARQSGGTGLGLAISRGLAQRMGGDVLLVSTEGQGTTAALELVLEQCAPALPPVSDVDAIPAAVQPSDPALAAVAVLVVDDHPVNRQIMVRQLSQLGIRAEQAQDGVEALECLRQQSFALVITDCEMPRMDGYTLTQNIRAGTWPCLPVLGCTAHALPEVAAKCLDSGMNQVLTKPVNLTQLAQALRRWLSVSVVTLPDDASAAAATDVIDAATLTRLCGNDTSMAHELLQSFLVDCSANLSAMAQALDAADLPTCQRLAHRALGASRVVGAQALALSLVELQQAARDAREPAAVDAALQRVRRECARVEGALSTMFPGAMQEQTQADAPQT